MNTYFRSRDQWKPSLGRVILAKGTRGARSLHYKVGIKRQRHEIFDLWFFQQTTYPGPIRIKLTLTLKGQQFKKQKKQSNSQNNIPVSSALIQKISHRLHISDRLSGDAHAKGLLRLSPRITLRYLLQDQEKLFDNKA